MGEHRRCRGSRKRCIGVLRVASFVGAHTNTAVSHPRKRGTEDDRPALSAGSDGVAILIAEQILERASQCAFRAVGTLHVLWKRGFPCAARELRGLLEIERGLDAYRADTQCFCGRLQRVAERGTGRDSCDSDIQ
jgi:hypothetical protein